MRRVCFTTDVIFSTLVRWRNNILPENVGFSWVFCFNSLCRNQEIGNLVWQEQHGCFQKDPLNLYKCTKLYTAIATFIFDSFIFPTKVNSNKLPSSEILNIIFGECIWGTLSAYDLPFESKCPYTLFFSFFIVCFPDTILDFAH